MVPERIYATGAKWTDSKFAVSVGLSGLDREKTYRIYFANWERKRIFVSPDISGVVSWSGVFELPLLEEGYGDEKKTLYIQLDCEGEILDETSVDVPAREAPPEQPPEEQPEQPEEQPEQPEEQPEEKPTLLECLFPRIFGGVLFPRLELGELFPRIECLLEVAAGK